MTVVVTVKINDGIVLAADSAVSFVVPRLIYAKEKRLIHMSR